MVLRKKFSDLDSYPATKAVIKEKLGVTSLENQLGSLASTDLTDSSDLIRSTEFNAVENRVDNLEENQYSGVVVYETLAELPATGTLLVSYKVSNDPDTTKNGYYHWDGAGYVFDAPLANGVIESGNADPISGGTVYDFLVANDRIAIKSFFVSYDTNLKWVDFATSTLMSDPSLNENEIISPTVSGTFTNLLDSEAASIVVPSEYWKYYIKKGSSFYSVETIFDMQSNIATSESNVPVLSKLKDYKKRLGNVAWETGVISSSSNTFYLKINVSGVKTMEALMMKSVSGTIGIAFFTSDESYIIGYNNDQVNGDRIKINIPDNAVYCLYPYWTDEEASSQGVDSFDGIDFENKIDNINENRGFRNITYDPFRIPKSVSNVDGSTASSNSSFYVKIDVSNFSKLKALVYKPSSDIYGASFFDANDNFISGYWPTIYNDGDRIEIDIPDTAKYCFYPYWNDDVATSRGVDVFDGVELIGERNYINYALSEENITSLSRIDGYAVNAKTGETVVNSSFFYAKIDVKRATFIDVPVVTSNKSSFMGIAFFDENDAYLDGFATIQEDTGTRRILGLPKNAAYILYSYLTDTRAGELSKPVFDYIKIKSYDYLTVSEIAQTTGDSETEIMSQKAVTDELNDITSNVSQNTSDIENLNNSMKFKGYYLTLSELQAEFPAPNDGDYAWVGSVYPGNIYTASSGTWSDTGIAAKPIDKAYKFVDLTTLTRNDGYGFDVELGQQIVNANMFTAQVDLQDYWYVNCQMLNAGTVKYGIGFFNTDDNFISGAYFEGINVGDRKTIKKPNNASYMIYSYSTDARATEAGYPLFDYLRLKNDADILNYEVNTILDVVETEKRITGITVSDITSDLMAHASVFKIDDDGTVYLVHYADDTVTTEAASNINTRAYLVVFNICNPQEKTTYLIAEAGQTIGAYTMSASRACYDVNIILESTEVKCLFTTEVSGELVYLCRTFNKASKTFTDIQILEFNASGTDFNLTNIAAYYQLTYPTHTVTSLIFLTKIISASDGYYYGYISGWGTWRGILIRSLDGLLWEPVSIINDTSITSVVEAEVYENDERIYVLFRINGVEIRMSYYDMNLGTWGNVEILPNSKDVKPQIFGVSSNVYVLYTPDSTIINDWGEIVRSKLYLKKVVDISTYNEFGDVNIFINENGIHYPTVINYKGTLYMSFSSDRRKLNLSYTRSEIDFVDITDFI